jgi:hypothetical protein
MEIPSGESCLQFIFRVSRWAVMGAALCLILPAILSAQDSSLPCKLTYTKTLKGSSPEFLSITVNSNGDALYEARKLEESSSSHPLKLSPATTRRIFQLAELMGNFESIDLESHKKVANLGLKTFVFEKEGRKNQVEFNYTLRRDAQDLVDLFEKISGVEQHILALEHAIKYDHLSLPKELLLIQMDLDKRMLADPELLVPSLEKIVRNPRFLHLAQARAQDILARLHNNRD